MALVACLAVAGCGRKADLPAPAVGSGAAASTPDDPRVALAKRLNAATHDHWLVDFDDRTLLISRLGGSDGSESPDAVATAKAFIATWARDAFGGADVANSFAVTSSTPARVRFTQKRGDLDAGGFATAVVDARGVVQLELRYVADAAAVNTTPRTSPDAVRERLIELARGSGGKTIDVAAPALVIAAPEHGPARLAYRTTQTIDGVALQLLVDANDASVIAGAPAAREIDGSGLGSHAYDGSSLERHFEVSQTGNRFALEWKVGGAAVVRIVTPDGKLVTSTDATRWEPSSSPDTSGAAVDAYVNLIAIYTFFAGPPFDWRSYDGKGSPLIGVVHLPVAVHAAWDTTALRVNIGDGNVAEHGRWYPSVALDVLGHEVMHGILQSRWDDAGLDQLLGDVQDHWALGESLGDVFGALVEHRDASKRAHEPYLIGEDVVVDRAIRDMAKPSLTGCIDYMPKLVRIPFGPSYYKALLDHTVLANAHVNAGIADNAFYLMTHGYDENPTSHLRVGAPITWDEAAQIWWRALARMSSGSGLRALATSTIAEASAAQRRSVVCAWIATGVLDAAATKTMTDTDCTPDAAPPADAGAASPETVPADAARADAAASDAAIDDKVTVVRPRSGTWTCMKADAKQCSCINMPNLSATLPAQVQQRVDSCTPAMVGGGTCLLVRSSGRDTMCGCCRDCAPRPPIGPITTTPVSRCPP